MKNKKMNITRKTIAVMAIVFILLGILSVVAFAETDAETALKKTDELMFSFVRLIGIAVCIWGVVEIGKGISTHDGGSRVVGFSIFAGGLIIAFAKQILTWIGVSL